MPSSPGLPPQPNAPLIECVQSAEASLPVLPTADTESDMRSTVLPTPSDAVGAGNVARPAECPADAGDNRCETSEDESRLVGARPARNIAGVVGVSRSATHSRKLKESMVNRTFRRKPNLTRTFLNEIAVLDGCAEMRDTADGATQVFHSLCGQWYTMKGPYSSIRFKEHVNGCGSKKTKGKTKGVKQSQGNPKAQKNTLDMWTKPKESSQRTLTNSADVPNVPPGSTLKSSCLPVPPSSTPTSKPSPALSKSEATTSQPTAKSTSKPKVITRSRTLDVFVKQLGWETQSTQHPVATVGDENTNLRPVAGVQHHQALQLPSQARVSTAPRPQGCTGLTSTHDERIPIYLRRTLTSGGGSKSNDKIAMKLYGQHWTTLSQRQKNKVESTQLQWRSWRNDHITGAVFSTSCSKFVRVADHEDAACTACRNLLNNHQFRDALNKAMKKSDRINIKRLNKKYRGGETVNGVFARVTGLHDLLSDVSKGLCFARVAR